MASALKKRIMEPETARDIGVNHHSRTSRKTWHKDRSNNGTCCNGTYKNICNETCIAQTAHKREKEPLQAQSFSTQKSKLSTYRFEEIPIADIPHSEQEQKKGLVTDCANIQLEPKSSTLDNSAKLSQLETLNQLSDLKSELQTLQVNYAIAEDKHSRASASAQAQIHHLQQRNRSQPRH